MKRRLALGVLVAWIVVLVGCQSNTKRTVRYEDEDLPVLLDDRYNDTDMKKIADQLVQSMVMHPTIANAEKPPVVLVTSVVNRTGEHIDVKSLTDKISVALLKTGKVQRSDEAARADLSDEYEYHASGNIDPATRTGPGHQVGADYVLRGDIADDVHGDRHNKVIFYKITLQLTDLRTNMIVWQDDVEIKKSSTQGRVGW